MMKYKLTLPALLASVLTCSACGTIPEAVPVEMVNTNTLDRHVIDVVETAETLEIVLDQNASELSLADKRRLQSFIRGYNDHGHGPLVMLLPEGTPNQQFAVGAVAEAREVAFENGVAYEEIAGGSKFGNYPSMILSFKSYDASLSDCPGFGEVDISDVRYNGELPNLGCSLRVNLAAMIADPADLLGERKLDPADATRRGIVHGLYREGQSTGSLRNESESGTVETGQ